MTLNNQFTKLLRDAAQEQNMSGAELARRSEMQQASVSIILRGEGNPTLATIERLAAALGKYPKITF
jgi:transcriptional regulator with XRE-family HTH domain